MLTVLDYERVNALTKRQLLTELLKGQQLIMSKQTEIDQKLAELQANLDTLTASEAKAQSDLTAVKDAVLVTVPKLQSDLKAAQEANKAQADLIDTFNADDTMTVDKLTALKANSDAATSAMSGIAGTAAEVLAVVKPAEVVVEGPV